MRIRSGLTMGSTGSDYRAPNSSTAAPKTAVLELHEPAGTLLICAQHFPEPNGAQFQEYRAFTTGRVARCVICTDVFETGAYVTHVWATPPVLPHCWVHTACWTGTPAQVEALIQTWHAAQQYACWF